jgi:hypothetical protein
MSSWHFNGNNSQRGDNPSRRLRLGNMAPLLEADFPPPALNVARSPEFVRFIAAASRTSNSSNVRDPFKSLTFYVFCS